MYDPIQARLKEMELASPSPNEHRRPFMRSLLDRLYFHNRKYDHLAGSMGFEGSEISMIPQNPRKYVAWECSGRYGCVDDDLEHFEYEMKRLDDLRLLSPHKVFRPGRYIFHTDEWEFDDIGENPVRVARKVLSFNQRPAADSEYLDPESRSELEWLLGSGLWKADYAPTVLLSRKGSISRPEGWNEPDIELTLRRLLHEYRNHLIIPNYRLP